MFFFLTFNLIFQQFATDRTFGSCVTEMFPFFFIFFFFYRFFLYFIISIFFSSFFERLTFFVLLSTSTNNKLYFYDNSELWLCRFVVVVVCFFLLVLRVAITTVILYCCWSCKRCVIRLPTNVMFHLNDYLTVIIHQSIKELQLGLGSLERIRYVSGI